MSVTSMRRRYLEDGVATATPVHLVVMLFDRLSRDLVEGADAIDAGDTVRAHEALTHAQDILMALVSALDTDRWVHANSLKGLYVWVVNELISANVLKDRGRVDGCRAVIEPLREAWREAESRFKVQAGGASAMTPIARPA
jgi:flagellar secretion chaperone FliS